VQKVFTHHNAQCTNKTTAEVNVSFISSCLRKGYSDLIGLFTLVCIFDSWCLFLRFWTPI